MKTQKNVFSLVILFFLSGAVNLFASTNATVGLCPGPGFHYTTISAALAAVPPGAVISVCPGNYPEQLLITQAVTLKGIASSTNDAVVIVPPAGGLLQNTTDLDTGIPVAAQILVQNTTGVGIGNLTVDANGSNINGCSPDPEGILFQNASGTVEYAAVRNQSLPPADIGCQSGEGIFVQTSTGTSTVTVENNSVHNYNKNGITGNDVGTTLRATGNYVQGSGIVTNSAAQNGIQIAFGAKGVVNSNTVIDNNYFDPTSSAASDILLYDAAENSNITVNSNTLGNSQIPIGIYTDTPGTYGDGVTVSSNKIIGTSVYDAIDSCTNGNTVTGNTIFDSAESGVHLDASCGGTGNSSTATGNTIMESACAGVLVDPGTNGNTVSPNTYFTVPSTTTNSCPNTPKKKAGKAGRFAPAR
jgi:hypothetical protein